MVFCFGCISMSIHIICLLRGGGEGKKKEKCHLHILHIKETKSATMNIFRNFLFSS